MKALYNLFVVPPVFYDIMCFDKTYECFSQRQGAMKANLFKRVFAAAVLLALIIACFVGLVIISGPPVKKVDTEKLVTIEEVVKAEIDKGNFPGAVVLVGQGGETLYFESIGNEVREPFVEVMGRQTIFDLASVTKPVATATSAMILRDRGKIKLDDYVKDFLPAFGCNGKEHVQIKHLLNHTSGLPPYTDANELEKEYGPLCPDKVLEKICSLEAQSKPGEEFRYSCLGYITLGKVVEAVTGTGLDVFAKENIYEPLGMKDTGYKPAALREGDIAATEIKKDKLLRGSVHDPLASLLGGVSGNAGLFSTASDLSIYCRMLLNNGFYNGRRMLSEEAVMLLTRSQAKGRAYGFDVSSSYSWIRGTNPGEATFCHSGYTGTSIVCDPQNKVFVIILTNRAHPEDKGSVKAVRTQVADIVSGAMK
jgi:CubicO group peptidase (beta-lactamase class C family)